MTVKLKNLLKIPLHTWARGFHICLGRDGKKYDDLKYCWMEARQVWTYAKLYNEIPRYHNQDILKTAIKAAYFLKMKMKDPKTNRCYLIMTREGKPVKMQKTIFSECFYCLAMSELARATRQDEYQSEALLMFDKIVYLAKDNDTELGLNKLPGCTESKALAVPMMLLCLVNQLESMGNDQCQLEMKKKFPFEKLNTLADWSIKQIYLHMQRNGDVILENISPQDKELTGSFGRLMNPGHAIECGWFMLERAIKTGDEELKKIALEKFICKSLTVGWDKKCGGLFYFLDADGLPPTQLEWDMKLWWPHAEAMIAFLMAYKETRDEKYLLVFNQIFQFVYSHFVDDTYGEWYGYLDRKGTVKMDFKGGPWKGCFHVPRCLIMCEKMLREMHNES